MTTNDLETMDTTQVQGLDHVLAFALLMQRGSFHHRKWLIKAALNYTEGKSITEGNEDVPNFL